MGLPDWDVAPEATLGPLLSHPAAPPGANERNIAAAAAARGKLTRLACCVESEHEDAHLLAPKHLAWVEGARVASRRKGGDRDPTRDNKDEMISHSIAHTGAA